MNSCLGFAHAALPRCYGGGEQFKALLSSGFGLISSLLPCGPVKQRRR